MQNGLITRQIYVRLPEDVWGSCENIHKLTVMRQHMVLERAFQVETMLADVALESSHARVRELMRFQHGRSLEFRRAEIARVRGVRGVDDQVGPEAAGPQEALAAGRALVRPCLGVHQLAVPQRPLLQHLLLATEGILDSFWCGVRRSLMISQLVFLLIKKKRILLLS